MAFVIVSEESTGGSAPSSRSGVGLLRSSVRRDIVDTLANLPARQRPHGLSARELGDLVGLHVTTVRFHLTQLIEAGLLTSRSERTSGAGRPTKKYVIAPGSFERLPDELSQRLLAALLTETFTARTEDGDPLTPEEVGAAWAQRHVDAVPGADAARTAGARLSSIGRMIDVLQQWGYTPDVRTENAGRTARIDLVGCPFIDLARSHPEVVCGIHRGLMRGTLDVLGERDAELSLEPFVDDDHCLAHVTTRTSFAARGGTS